MVQRLFSNDPNQRPGGAQLSPPPPEQKKPEETRNELRQAIVGSNDVLVSATTTLTIFPDTITVDRAKLTITRRTFLRTAEIMSIRIEDILNATATVGPFFGTVKIVSRVMNSDAPHSVGLFWRNEAMRVKRITQGYIIALQREIDCSALQTVELVNMLEQLGEDEHPL